MDLTTNESQQRAASILNVVAQGLAEVQVQLLQLCAQRLSRMTIIEATASASRISS